MGLVAGIAIASAVVTGRIPGTTEDVTGPRLASRTTTVAIEAGLARTEIEDVLVNDDFRELEARYVLRIPRGAVVSRLALDVNGSLVEGSVLERDRAHDIYRSIVDEARRDPALISRNADGSLSVRIFPLAGRGSRRIVVAYDEAVRDVPGDVAEVTLGAEAVVLRAALGKRLSQPESRAIAIDVSRGQSDEALATEISLVRRILGDMKEGSEFVLLACDSACESMPAAGLSAKTEGTLASADMWLRGLKQRGARDLAGAIADASTRARAGGQAIWIGAGKATAGELDAHRVAAQVRAASVGMSRELRLVAVGDDGPLERLAQASAATYDELPGQCPSECIAEADGRLRQHAIVAPRIELPPSIEVAAPRVLPSVRAGGALAILGAARGAIEATQMPAKVTVRATVAGRPWSVEVPVHVVGRSPRADLLLAGARVDALERRGDVASVASAARIARTHHVLATHASFLALESDAMMQAFGIARGAAPPWQGPHSPSLRMAMSMVVARVLPADTIQRVVRNNAGRFRFCYEAGLRSHPGLAGRVVVKFVIASTGVVTSSNEAGSDLADSETVACFVRTFRELTFPEVRGVATSVVYPFVLAPVEGTAHSPGALLPLRVPKSDLPDPHELWLLRHRVEESLNDPTANEALVAALDELGDHEAATTAVEAFVRAARDEPRAYELLRRHAAPVRASEAIDALADLSSRCAAAHARAADAWMAVGDLRRAAAHRRSIVHGGNAEACAAGNTASPSGSLPR